MTEDEYIKKHGLKDDHCESCHEDDGMGYEMCYVTDAETDEEVYVCCRVAGAKEGL